MNASESAAALQQVTGRMKTQLDEVPNKYVERARARRQRAKRKGKSASKVPRRVKPTYHPESHPALEYLSRWAHDRQNWKFQKVRQVYLLQRMFDRDRVPKPYFGVLLQYLNGMAPSQKLKTIQIWRLERRAARRALRLRRLYPVLTSRDGTVVVDVDSSEATNAAGSAAAEAKPAHHASVPDDAFGKGRLGQRTRQLVALSETALNVRFNRATKAIAALQASVDSSDAADGASSSSDSDSSSSSSSSESDSDSGTDKSESSASDDDSSSSTSTSSSSGSD